MYDYDPRSKTDDGILRLCKEIKEHWDGKMIPPNQYGLNEAWNKITSAEVNSVPSFPTITCVLLYSYHSGIVICPVEIFQLFQSLDVKFAVRSNVTFNGLLDDDSPIHGKAVTFRVRDCLHIKAVSITTPELCRCKTLPLFALRALLVDSGIIEKTRSGCRKRGRGPIILTLLISHS